MTGKSFRLISVPLIIAAVIAVGAMFPTGTFARANATMAATASGPVAVAKPGQNVSLTLLPKFVGIAVFEEANQGALEASKELQSTGKYQMVVPNKAEVQTQIQFIRSLRT